MQRHGRKWRKEKPKALVFYKMETEEESDRYIEQCFVNGLYAPDGEINLAKDDNLISNNYAVKLHLEYDVRNEKKLVKKELMVSLRGEIYIVQFIINPEEDEFEPSLIIGRSFLRFANAVTNSGKMLLDFDFDEVPPTKTDLPPIVCKMGKGSKNKKKVLENIMYFHNGAGPSSSIGKPLTQEEAKKRALAHSISMRYEVLEEERPVIETLACHDKYRKLLDEIWEDKVKLDGMIKPEEERAMIKGLVNENALADTGSDINTMPYRIYEHLGRDDIMPEKRNITMINYTEGEVIGRLVDVLCQVRFTTLTAKFLILEIPIDRDAPIVVGR
ncbi:ribonuclease H-like domain-containing protein [Tanacetum coccineum]